MAASILLVFAPILIGSALIVLAFRWLSDGVTRLRWSDSEIEAARLWAESHELHRIAKWFLWVFVLADVVGSYVVFHFWKISHHTSTRMFFDSLALVCIPSLVVSDVGDRLREAGSAPTSTGGGPRRHPGFQSEHWGER
jgi:hypothetical protein